MAVHITEENGVGVTCAVVGWSNVVLKGEAGISLKGNERVSSLAFECVRPYCFITCLGNEGIVGYARGLGSLKNLYNSLRLSCVSCKRECFKARP